MIDARNYAVQETLKNGLQVTTRAIRPDDRDALQAAFKGLDKRTVSLRFFGPKKELTDREFTAATVVDFIRTVALVTCVQDGADEKIIGAGRYVAIGSADPPDRAEVAFTVEEDYQGLAYPALHSDISRGSRGRWGLRSSTQRSCRRTRECSRSSTGAGSPYSRKFLKGSRI
jgi:hypothetical protein